MVPVAVGLWVAAVVVPHALAVKDSADLIAVGHRVMRGPDWYWVCGRDFSLSPRKALSCLTVCFAPFPAGVAPLCGLQGDQDGGKGGKGTVIELRPWRGEPDRKRYGARVKWDNGDTNTYRWGAEGKFDLEIVGAIDEDLAKAYIVPQQGPASCHESDMQALLQIYSDLNGAKWAPIHAKGWRQRVAGDETDPCTDKWTGVLCEKTRIVAL